MTFHDDVHIDYELEAKRATRCLQLWINTIAPAESVRTDTVNKALSCLICDMGWPSEYDRQLDCFLVTVS